MIYQFLNSASKGNTEEVLKLISRGGDIDYRNNGYTALAWASIDGHIVMVVELLKAGANVDLVTEVS